MSPMGLVRSVLTLGLAALVTACAGTTASNPDSLYHATVLIENAKGHGSGTIVGPGQVLTAHHVVADASPLEVTFYDGRARPGRVSRQHPALEALDLALIEVEVPAGYPAPELTCAAPRRGQHLMALGHPTQSRWVAVGGHLPSSRRIRSGGLVAMGFPIGLGTSGGPVFDEWGRVIGVSMAILAERESTSAGFESYKDTGIGLMLPVHDFCELISDQD